MSLIFTNQSFKQKWEWYENKELGFKFKYPPNWVVEGEKVEDIPTLFYVFLNPVEHRAGADICVISHPLFSVDEEVQHYLSILKEDGFTPESQKIEEISLGGETAIEITTATKYVKFIYIITEHKKRQYEITFDGVLTEVNKLDEEWNKILESFEFV
jgi:hypothetical protein